MTYYSTTFLSKHVAFKNAALFLFLIWLTVGCQDDVQPIVTDDYWETANPEAHGLAIDSLKKAINNAEGMPNFYALLVIKNNKLIAEEYFNGQRQNQLYQLRSITKNFTSALTGIAIEEGAIESVDSSIQPYFPSVVSGNKTAITVRHLLNMASGLAWDEDAEVVDLIEHRIEDPVNAILSRDLITDPGMVFNYNSVSTHIAADLIEQATQQSLREYTEEKLFQPLGISSYQWEKDPDGAEWGGFGLQLTARDLAKFGQLYLNQGTWEGKSLVPRSWVQLSSAKQMEVPGSTSGYSLHWWTSDGLSTPVYFGLGYGGQGLVLVPEKNMIVIGLQEYFVPIQQSADQWQRFQEDILIPIYRGVD